MCGARRLGRYRLLRHLATGGMAEIWLASIEERRRNDPSHAVIKVIAPDRARDRQFAHYRIKLAPVTDRATEPAVLFKILWRVRHHAEDVGVVVFAEDFTRAFV